MAEATGFTCKQLVELVTDYFEGALEDDERARFEAHTSECAKCERYLRQMRMTIDTAGRLTEDDVPRQAREQLLAVFRDWKAGGSVGATAPEPAAPKRLFARLVERLRG